MTSDGPLDLTQLGADHRAIESLRASLYEDPSYGFGGGPEPAVRLLHDLLRDVDVDVPPAGPVVREAPVLALAEAPARRRLPRNGALVAVLAAGLVSVGGAAAASTMAPAGTPLHGLGQSLRSGVGAVVTAVSLPEQTASAAGAQARPEAGPTVAAGAAPSPATQRPAAVDAESQAAARRVASLLDAAQRLLAQGLPRPASARLDTAAHHLVDVGPPDAAPLSARLEQLRRDVRAASAAPGGERRGDLAPSPPGRQVPPQGPPPGSTRSQHAPPQKPTPQKPTQQKATQKPPQQETPQKLAPQKPAQQKAPQQQDSEKPAQQKAPQKAGPGPAGQLSKDASTKPRA
jgi:hypothetical protein